MTTLNLLQEMQSFVSVAPEFLAKAKTSKITDKNNSQFKDILDGWKAGDYDESPEQVVSDISSLIN